MGTNGINEALSAGFKVKLQNRGAKSSGITFELKSVFDELAKQGLIKDTDGKGLTKQDALNLYNELNKIHQETKRATNYTTMQVGQEFDYTADEMKALAKAAGYEVVEQPLTETPPTAPEQPSEPEPPSDDGTVTPQQEEPVVTGPSDDPEYEQSRLSLVEADFDVNGQVGKISDGKYYINGKEVSKDVYDTAKAKAMSASAGMHSLPDIKPDEVVPDGVKSVEILKDKIKENRSENRELRADLREMRKEIRQANQDERRKDRLERQEIRQENRLERRLDKVTPTFDYDGNVGKILDGKFYLNGKEVTAGEFNAANNPSKPKTMSDEQLAQYLEKDISYQEHKKTLQYADNLMKEIETKYNFERGDIFGDLRLAKADKEASAAYKEAKRIYNTYTEGLSDYEQEMANWVDGPAEWSLVERNGMRWTNLERITLSNGQRAWKTDQGVFYPGPDGMPSDNKVEEEYLE